MCSGPLLPDLAVVHILGADLDVAASRVEQGGGRVAGTVRKALKDYVQGDDVRLVGKITGDIDGVQGFRRWIEGEDERISRLEIVLELELSLLRTGPLDEQRVGVVKESFELLRGRRHIVVG